MKCIKFFVLFFTINLLLNFNLSATEDIVKGGKFARFKSSVSSFIKNLPTKAKNKIASFNYDDTDELNFIFNMSFGKKQIPFGFRWNWEAGSGDVSTGFSSFSGELVSPTLGDLGFLPTETPNNILRIHLLNVLLGVGSQTEKDVARADIVQKIANPLRNLLGQKFLVTLQNIMVLKPIYIFYIKLILLAKTYLPQKRFKDASNQIMSLLIRLMQTVDIDATIKANNGERNPRKWVKKVYYADPTEFVRVLPGFISDILKEINIPVPLDSYQEWQDKASGKNDYDKQVSETMRREGIDSQVKYAKENLQPLFSTQSLTLSDAKMIAYLSADFVYNKDLAKRNDTKLFIRQFITKAVEAINRIKTSNTAYKEKLTTRLKNYSDMLSSGSKLDKEPVVDDFKMAGKKEVMIINALTYYIYLLKSNMNYPFYGDMGYLYSDARLGKDSTVTFASRLAFRVFKDSRKALRQAIILEPDVNAVDSYGNLIRDKQGNVVKFGKKAYQDAIGKAGLFDLRTGDVKQPGFGPYFEWQKAKIELRRANAILKTATAKLPKGDSRLVEYKKMRDAARKALLIANKNLKLAKGQFMLRVVRYYKFKRAKEIESETIIKFVLRELKRLSMRSKFLIPLLDVLNSTARDLLGFELVSKEDLEKEPSFDEKALLTEETFNYDDISGEDALGGYGEDQFAF